jgi:cytochrome b subunit of formate dehydrogenase
MQLTALYLVKIALSVTGIALNKLQESSKLLSLLASLYILMQKAPALCACYIVRKIYAALFGTSYSAAQYDHVNENHNVLSL